MKFSRLVETPVLEPVDPVLGEGVQVGSCPPKLRGKHLGVVARAYTE